MSEAPPKKKPKSLPAKLFAFMASYGVGIVVLAFLLLLTWLGTVEQTEMSLFDVQRKYFDSVYFLQDLGPLKIPLPGVYLLLGILFVNMVCGGIIRIRKNWRTIGVIIAHFSILFLIVAGWVSFHYKIEGHLQLYEDQESNVFTSYHDRVIEIAEAGKEDPVLMIPEEHFSDLEGTKSRAFHASSLPFELAVSNYHKNCQVLLAEMHPATKGEPIQDGYYLRGEKADKEAERNLPGVFVALQSAKGEANKAILWDWATAPFTYRADGRTFTLRLRRKAWELPFQVKLNRFTHEYHPGTMRPKLFESQVTKTEDGVSQEAKIEMNKPLRRNGYTLFQASWGPPNWQPYQGRDKLYSVFAVVKNPSDKWPEYACIMAAIGMGLHFIIKLILSLQRASRREGETHRNSKSS